MCIFLRRCSRAFGITFLMWTLMYGQPSELAAQASEKSVHFWEAATSQIDYSNLTPAVVRLIATPVADNANFATFRAQGTPARSIMWQPGN